MGAVDCLVTLPIKGAVWELEVANLPLMQGGYKKLYADIKHDNDFLRDMPDGHGGSFADALRDLTNKPIEEFIKVLDKAGVDRAICRSHDARVVGGRHYPVEVVAGIAKKYPNRIIPFVGIDPFLGEESVKKLEYAIRDLGMRGLYLAPWELNIYSNDKRLFPLFKKCSELKVPLYIHCSINFGVNRVMYLTHPMYLDEIAVNFPDLKIIANHAGWPWVLELVAVAWRNKNVYIGTANMRPKHIGTPKTGWDPLVQYGNSVIKDKVLFGTGWPALPFKRSIEEVNKLPLKDEVKEMWLSRNALRIFEN